MDALIRVNNTKECELEFDVTIQGISVDSPENAAQVRLVITNVHGGDLAFKCERRADSTTKWFVKLPPLPMLSSTTNAHAFHMEVIIDGYYFEPAAGNLILLKDPEVSVSNTSKPKVTANIRQSSQEDQTSEKEKKQEDPVDTKDAKEDKKDEKVEERAAQAAGNLDGQSAPTTALLTPEFPPEDPAGDERMKSKHRRMPEDEQVNQFKLFKRTPPEQEEQPEDPEDIAERVIKETLGKNKKPAKPGFLFKHVDGKPLIEGLEPDLETKQKLNEKAQKVKDLLKQDRKKR